MAAIRHLEFLKVRKLTASTILRVNAHHHAKFRADRSNRCRETTVFRFSKWRPSAIFNL